MELLASFNSFIQLIFSFIPRYQILRATEGGVKFVRGWKIKILKPGLIPYWPITTEIEVVNIKRQVLRLPVQTLYTKDEQTVIAGGVVVYSITNPYKYIVDNYDAQDSIDDVAAAALREIVTNKTVSEIQSNTRKSTDNAFTKEVAEALEEFGVTIEKARLTHFAPSKVINIVTAGSISEKSMWYDDSEEDY